MLLDNETNDQFGIDQEEAISANTLIDSACIAVFEAYETDSSSGYAGKLISVVWSTEPTTHEVFIWRNAVLQQIG